MGGWMDEPLSPSLPLSRPLSPVALSGVSLPLLALPRSRCMGWRGSHPAAVSTQKKQGSHSRRATARERNARAPPGLSIVSYSIRIPIPNPRAAATPDRHRSRRLLRPLVVAVSRPFWNPSWPLPLARSRARRGAPVPVPQCQAHSHSHAHGLPLPLLVATASRVPASTRARALCETPLSTRTPATVALLSGPVWSCLVLSGSGICCTALTNPQAPSPPSIAAPGSPPLPQAPQKRSLLCSGGPAPQHCARSLLIASHPRHGFCCRGPPKSFLHRSSQSQPSQVHTHPALVRLDSGAPSRPHGHYAHDDDAHDHHDHVNGPARHQLPAHDRPQRDRPLPRPGASAIAVAKRRKHRLGQHVAQWELRARRRRCCRCSAAKGRADGLHPQAVQVRVPHEAT